MKKLSVSITLPDNGGIAFFGPLTGAPTAKSTSINSYPNQRMYICPSQDPVEVGKTLMTMLADLRLSDVPITPPVDLDKEIEDITF